jgi:hypothetical protein
MHRAPDKAKAISWISAWLMLGTATCIAAAAVQASSEVKLAIAAVWAVAGQLWALRRAPSWTESALALGCVPYFAGLVQWWGSFCEQSHRCAPDNGLLSGWGMGLAAASATAALTIAAKCLELFRSLQK